MTINIGPQENGLPILPFTPKTGYAPLNKAVGYLIAESKKNPHASNGTMILDFNNDGKFNRADLLAKVREYRSLSSPTIEAPIKARREKIQNEIFLIQSVLRGEDLFMKRGISNEKTAVSLFDFNIDGQLNAADLRFKNEEANTTGSNKVRYEVKMLESMGLEPSPPPVDPPPVDPSLTKEWTPTKRQSRIDQVHLASWDLANNVRTSGYDVDKWKAQSEKEAATGTVSAETTRALQDARNKEAEASEAYDIYFQAHTDVLASNAMPTSELSNLYLAFAEFERIKLTSNSGTGADGLLLDEVRTMIQGFKDGVYPPKNDINAMIKRLKG
ncbi:MAG: hypothetical protein HEQ32_05300 [Vampirovibrio sp.]